MSFGRSRNRFGASHLRGLFAHPTCARANDRSPGISSPPTIERTMNERIRAALSVLDVTGVPVFFAWFIWRGQFLAPLSSLALPVWLVVSFLLHRDNPKTLGMRADNLWPATKQAAIVYGFFALCLFLIGMALQQGLHLPPNYRSFGRLWAYFAFCLFQQIMLNSLLMNRLLSLARPPVDFGYRCGNDFRRAPLAQSRARAAHIDRRHRHGLDVRARSEYPAARRGTIAAWLAGLVGVSDCVAPHAAGWTGILFAILAVSGRQSQKPRPSKNQVPKGCGAHKPNSLEGGSL